MAQNSQIADTIRAMKLALRRQPDGYPNDAYTHAHTNRGNKLHRKAQHTREGRLDSTGGNAFRRPVQHAGYTRHVISTNPRYYDEDGEPYSPTASDHEHGHLAEPEEEDPFGEIKLESLLRPLTSAAELPSHPSISLAYTSNALSQMTVQAQETLRRERASLWKAKRLLQRFWGDVEWVSCAMFEGASDEELFGPVINGGATDNHAAESPAANDGIAEPNDGVDREDHQAIVDAVKEHDKHNKTETLTMAGVTPNMDNDITMLDDDSIRPTNGHAPSDAPDEQDINMPETASEAASLSNVHAMTTRARARSPADNSEAGNGDTDGEDDAPIDVHPWFRPSKESLPDRDLGLPAGEAEETRRLLLLYVQKQEQIVRSLDVVYQGLQRADRLRRFVYRSCRADGHLVSDGKGNMVTEMSDGEDWYDIDDWGIEAWELRDGQLEKGKDEDVDGGVEEEGRRGPRRRVRRM